MPEQSTAATEHAITQDLSSLPAELQERAAPPSASETKEISTLPAHETQQLIATVVETDFPVVLRGYDRDAVDAYVRRTSRLVAELQASRSPAQAVKRAVERVGEDVADILRRAHETAEQVTTQSRKDADERLQRAEREAQEITASARASLRDLDADTDRIWAERHRIIDDARALGDELRLLADAAAERFPAAEEDAGVSDAHAAQEDDEDSAVLSVSHAANGSAKPANGSAKPTNARGVESG